MDAPPDTQAPQPLAAVVPALAAAKVALHLACAGVYGFFIDELYFLACGEHLAWGYVDFPPLTAFQAWLTRHLFGDSPYSIRLFPSLAVGGLVLMTGAFSRRLQGGRFAQGTAALAVALAPIWLVAGSYLSMNSVEPLVVTGCALLVVRMIQSGDTRLWVAFGALSGIGLLNKHTMAAFGFALVAGLLLTPERRLLASRWLLVGGAVALLIAAPNLAWEVRHGFPHRELLANIARNGRDVDVSVLQFWGLELLFLGPLAAPLWLGGLAGLFALPSLRRYRSLGIAWLVVIGLFLVLTRGSHKSYYVTPAYPVLFAAGGVFLERLLASPRFRRVKPVYAGLLGVAGVALVPITLPSLPPELYVRYTKALGIAQPRLENRAASAMPQLFADRFGWPEMVETVARVWKSLPEAERVRTGIFANDYGQGGAIDFYGSRHGLPKAIGGHLSYWYWGPRGYTGESLIVLGDRREVLEREFEEVLAVAEVGHPYAMRQEHFTLFLCRKPRGWTLAGSWPRLKNWS